MFEEIKDSVIIKIYFLYHTSTIIIRHFSLYFIVHTCDANIIFNVVRFSFVFVYVHFFPIDTNTLFTETTNFS